jgi:hypothetical protein
MALRQYPKLSTNMTTSLFSSWSVICKFFYKISTFDCHYDCVSNILEEIMINKIKSLIFLCLLMLCFSVNLLALN